jgi:SAM-dependent methyltransferase
MIVAAMQGMLRSIRSGAESCLGRPAALRTEDRRILEEQIIPALADRADIRRVLFVGCASYTRHYELLFDRQEYWTIDPSPLRERWRARRHIRDRLEHLGRHVASAYFDAIVCNGVLGWGLDRRVDAEAAFRACHEALRAGGELIVGWNDVKPRNRVNPASLRSLARFGRTASPLTGATEIRIDAPHRHVFEFYRKARDPGGTDEGFAQQDSVVIASPAART